MTTFLGILLSVNLITYSRVSKNTLNILKCNENSINYNSLLTKTLFKNRVCGWRSTVAVDTVIQLYLRKSVQTINRLFTIKGLSIISMRIHVLLNLLIIIFILSVNTGLYKSFVNNIFKAILIVLCCILDNNNIISKHDLTVHVSTITKCKLADFIVILS